MNQFEPLGSILAEILSRRGVESTDGSPLFFYRVTAQELDRVRRSLRVVLASRRLSRDEESAAFCLYFAEVFRQKHESGRWKWETVLEGLSDRWQGPDFYDAVERGLRWWGRELVVVGSQRLFLVTLACEGGLPLHLLRKQGSSLRTYFQRLLAEIESNPGRDPETCARELVHHLPKTLANDNMIAYSARLVSSIAKLRSKVAGSDSPMEALESRFPDWRREVPLNLAEENAEELLKGLVTAARPRERAGATIRVTGSLELGPVPRFRREIAVPGRMLPSQVFGSITTPEPPPQRLRLRAQLEDGTRVPVATATLRKSSEPEDEGGFEYVLESKRVGRHTYGRVSLVVLGPEGEIGSRSLPGGEPIDELPLLFEDSESPVLKLTGSGTTSANSAILAFHSRQALACEDSEVIGELGETGRTLARIRENAELEADGELYRFRLGGTDDSHQYVLVGPRAMVGTRELDFWKGPPALRVSNEDGCLEPVSESQVEWRPVGGAWGPLRSSSCGEGTIRYRADGEVRFRARIAVLPRGFSCRVVPGASRGEGSLQFTGLHSVEVVDPSELSQRTTLRDGRCDLHLEIDGDQPPRSVTIRAGVDGSRSLQFEAPFPGECMTLLGPDGRPVPPRGRLSLSRVPGARIMAISQAPRVSFYLEARAPGVRQFLGEVPKSTEGVFEQSLDTYAQRLKRIVATYPDSVTLHLVRAGGVHAEERFEVKPYPCELRVEPTESWLEIVISDAQYCEDTDRDKQGDIDVVVLDALRPLSGAIVEADATEGVGLRYRAPYPIPRHSLIVSSDPELVARPEFYVAEENQAGSECSAEVRAGRPDWELIEETFEAISELPHQTLPEARSLIRSESLLAEAALRFSNRSWFTGTWDALSEGSLLWETLPVRDWYEALRSLCEGVGDSATAEVVKRGYVDSLSKRVRDRFPFVQPLFERATPVVDQSDGGSSESGAQEAAEAVLEVNLVEAWQQLRQRKSTLTEAGRWPRVRSGLRALVERLGLQDEYRRVMGEPELEIAADVHNAPMVTALTAIFGLWDRVAERDREDLVIIRDFDRDWFQVAHAATLGRLIAMIRNCLLIPPESSRK